MNVSDFRERLSQHFLMLSVVVVVVVVVTVDNLFNFISLLMKGT